MIKCHMWQFEIPAPPHGKKIFKTLKRLTANKYSTIHFLISATIFNNSLGNVLPPVSLHTPNPLASSPPAVSSIFTVPNVKLQTESGDSIQVCARRNSHGKASSGSKHWPEAAFCTWLPDRYVLITMRTKSVQQLAVPHTHKQNMTAYTILTCRSGFNETWSLKSQHGWSFSKCCSECVAR